MKKEFWAEFDMVSDTKKHDIIHYFVEKSLHDGQLLHAPRKQNGQLPWEMLEDKAARQHILAQLLATEEKCGNVRCKDYAKSKNGLQWWYYAGDMANPRGNFQDFLCRRLRWMASILNFGGWEDTVNPSLPDLSIFPPGSWTIQINFTLRKPYISRDDTDFYIVDNPVKKEWVFKVPYVAPSQWKGALRSAMVRELVMKLSEKEIDEEKFFEERIRLYRLFGNEKDGTAEFLNRALARFHVGTLPNNADGEAKEQWEQRVKQEIKNVAEQFKRKLGEKGYRVGDIEGFQGYLHFYPTFFDKIGLEVINPHDRRTGTGKQPIYFECVPQGTKGSFTLLYVPMKEVDEDTSKEDLIEVAKGIKAMLTKCGFGAKTSSGYGVADVNVQQTKIKPEGWKEIFIKGWDENG